jgi:hypothetical protein
MRNDTKSAEYTKNAERYRKDDEEIQKQAQELEGESHIRGRQALRLHFGEVFLEISIVLASLAILSKRATFWYAAMAGGVVGAIIGATAYFVS